MITTSPLMVLTLSSLSLALQIAIVVLDGSALTFYLLSIKRSLDLLA